MPTMLKINLFCTTVLKQISLCYRKFYPPPAQSLLLVEISIIRPHLWRVFGWISWERVESWTYRRKMWISPRISHCLDLFSFMSHTTNYFPIKSARMSYIYTRFVCCLRSINEYEIHHSSTRILCLHLFFPVCSVARINHKYKQLGVTLY